MTGVFCIFAGPLTFKNEQGKHCLIGVVSFGPKTCVDKGNIEGFFFGIF